MLLACWHSNPIYRPNPLDIYNTLTTNENIIQPLLSCPALAEIRESDSVELDLSPTVFKPSTLLKKPFLRQSSSVISVDSEYIESAYLSVCHVYWKCLLYKFGATLASSLTQCSASTTGITSIASVMALGDSWTHTHSFWLVLLVRSMQMRMSHSQPLTSY